MSASDAREVIVLNGQFGSGATSYSPATWYVALSTTAPNDDGTNFTEPSVGSYARVAYTNNGTNWPGASTTAGVTSTANGTACTFPTATADWGSIGWVGVFTASSGGTPQFYRALNSIRDVKNGNTPIQFSAGQLVWTCD